MFKIYDGRFEFYQWDLDRKLIVEDPTITEVHFCNKTDNCSLVVEVYEQDGLRLANVPNILLQSNWDIRVFGYCGNCYTKASARFSVIGRTKPADYIYTETEVKTWETLSQKCEETLELAETLTKGAIGGKSFLDYAALVANLNAAEKSDYYCPQHLLIRTLNVPDLWIYEVKDESVQYEYIDDQTIIDGLVNGLIQVGYFVLSALETGKVNLEDYATKEEVSGKLDKREWTGGANTYKLYGIKYNGEQILMDATHYNHATRYTIPMRNVEGNIRIPDYVEGQPTDAIPAGQIAVNKNYVDGVVSEKLDKITRTPPANTTYIYSKRSNGEDTYELVSGYNMATAWTIPSRGAGGNIRIPNYVEGQGTNGGAFPEGELAVNKNYVDNAVSGKLDADTSTGTGPRVYAISQDGEQLVIPLQTTAQGGETSSYTVVRRLASGVITLPDVNVITDNNIKQKSAVRYDYVHSLIADLQAQIDELKGN